MSGKPHREAEAQVRALRHPLRLHILHLASLEPAKSLSARALTKSLKSDYPDLKVPQVAYHLDRLRDAGLVPRSALDA